MNRDETVGWMLAIAVAVGLFLGMRAGWSPHRGYSFVKGGLLAIPLVIKGAHSLWSWMRERGN